MSTSPCSALGSNVIMLSDVAGDAFDSSSLRHLILYENLKTDRGLIGGRGISGTRSNWAHNIKLKSFIPRGGILIQPGPADFDVWLQRALGGTKSGNTIALTETIPEFDLLINRENGTFKYSGCQVAQLYIEGSTNNGGDGEEEIINMMCVVVAKTEDDAATWPETIPALPTTLDYSPYNFAEGVLTLNSNARYFDKFRLNIDNRLLVRTRNSLTPTCIKPTDRQVRLEIEYPFSSTQNEEAKLLYNTGAAASLAFTNATVSTTFTFPFVRNEYTTPTTPGKNEIPASLKLRALRTSSNLELVVTNDSTV